MDSCSSDEVVGGLFSSLRPFGPIGVPLHAMATWSSTWRRESVYAVARRASTAASPMSVVPAQVKSISKTQVVACMNPGAGSFFINPRLQRWFVTFAIGMPQRASLNVIYDTFLNGHLSRGFADEVLALKDP